jgi:hypothetical protein
MPFCGLPTNPGWVAEQGLYHHVPPEELERWLNDERDETRIEIHRQQIAEAIKFEKDTVDWEVTFNASLDLHRARLFVALREGKVVATGKKLSGKLLTRLINDENKREIRRAASVRSKRGEIKYAKAPRWETLDRQPIPKEFWNSTGINWKLSCAANGVNGFGLVLVDTMQLLAAFPIPEVRNVKRAFQVGDAFVLLDDEGNTQDAPASRLGRPSYRWEEFNIEMAKRVRDGALPEKQEAMISNMQAWCLKQWGRQVARSTLLSKIKPYYDAFSRTSKK